MNVMNITHNKDLFLFCEESMNPNFMSKIEKKGKGLSDPNLEDNLKKGNYQEVLIALWSENDRTRQVEWLESKFDELHPVLMYELGIAKFQLLQTVETINNFCLPLLSAANFRVAQDAKCAKDKSINSGDAAFNMYYIYSHKLDNEICFVKNTSKVFENEFNQYLKAACEAESFQRKIAMREKILDVAKKSIEVDLPAPDWIG